jgi:hypothetical protein
MFVLVLWAHKKVDKTVGCWRASTSARDLLQDVMVKGGSQFWQGVNKIKHKLKRGLSSRVNNGERVLFWEDVWLGRTPLKLTFPKLYEYCRNKDCWSASVTKMGSG